MNRPMTAKPVLRFRNIDTNNRLHYVKLEDRRVLNGDPGTSVNNWEILAEETEYNDQGWIVSQNLWIDTDNDQVADLRTTDQYTYDSAGNNLTFQRAEDWGADGTVDFMSRWTYVYDESGELIRGINEIDHDGDGVIDEVIEEFYDNGGDNNNPGGPEPRITADETFDSEGRLLHGSYAYDYDLDGTDDYRESVTNTYLADGRLDTTRTEVDYEADGAIDYITLATSEYDDDGQLIAIHHQIDQNGDGEFDYSYTDDLTDNPGGPEPRVSANETFDGEGRLLHGSYAYDYDLDGTDDYRESVTNTYLADGRLDTTRMEVDYEADGVIDYISLATSEYDDDGQLIAIHHQIDENGDGEFDYSYTNSVPNNYGGEMGNAGTVASPADGTPRNEPNGLDVGIVGQTYFRSVLGDNDSTAKVESELTNPPIMPPPASLSLAGSDNKSLDDAEKDSTTFRLFRRARNVITLEDVNVEEPVEEAKKEDAIPIAQQSVPDDPDNKTTVN